MKIISLQAENVKKLTAVSITPAGNMVEITGPNGSGKTSVLDCIWWALTGAKHIQTAPIRTGENKATIKLDLGELKVIRTLSRKEDGYTTKIRVETEDGASFKSPQRMIDELLGELTFDPLAFTRMTPRAQFDVLCGFTTVDFAKYERGHDEDYRLRAEENRKVRQFEAMAESIPIMPADTAPVLVGKLTDDLQAAAHINSTRDREREDRRRRLDSAKAAIEESNTEIERRKGIIDRAVAALDDLSKLPPLSEPIDIDQLRKQIDDGVRHNSALTASRSASKSLTMAEMHEARAKELSDNMAAAQQAKEAEIAAADLPIEGIGFGDGVVLLGGVPFDQASDAEQLRASVAMAMAANPRLRVIRIRDGSLLDENAMKLLADIVDEKDFQCWVERVDTSGKIGFVMEDGHIKGHEPEEKPHPDKIGDGE